jgi:hypothetical protein
MMTAPIAYAGDYNEGNTGSSPKSDGGGTTGANSDLKGQARADYDKQKAREREARSKMAAALKEAIEDGIVSAVAGGAAARMFTGDWSKIAKAANGAGWAAAIGSYLKSTVATWRAGRGNAELAYREPGLFSYSKTKRSIIDRVPR